MLLATVNIYDPLWAPVIITIAIITSSPLIYVPLGVLLSYAAYRWVRA